MTQDEINLQDMSQSELSELRAHVDRALTDYDTRQRQKAMAEVAKVAGEYGFSMADLMKSKRGGRRKFTPQPPRYRHPKNPQVTWSGRGRPPAWMREHIEAGARKKTSQSSR